MSSLASVEVAITTSCTVRQARTRCTTWASTGWPASGSSTLPGKRVELMRAWMMATTFMGEPVDMFVSI
jgi:hypothetical protein